MAPLSRVWIFSALLLVGVICTSADEDIEDGITVETEDEDQYQSPKVDPKKVYLAEHFDNMDAFKKKWVKSEAKKQGVDENLAKYDGTWEVRGPERTILKDDLGLVLTTEAKHAAISALLDRPFEFKDKPLIVQYEVTMQEGQNCGGAYLKLLSKGINTKSDLRNLHDQTPYTIMFGPDKCGNDHKLHFIFRHKNPKNGSFEEKHSKKPSTRLDDFYKDKEPHLYTLIVRPDNTFQVLVDNKEVNSGHLLEDFTPPVNPPEEIDDPSDKKPEDWDEREKIVDPTAVKPQDWDEDAPAQIVDPNAVKPDGWLDDEPEMIPDPEAKKPADWDEEMDGEWEAPLIDNPACSAAPGCGQWNPPTIPNPNYKVTCYLNERCRITDLSEVRSRVPAPAFHLPTSLKLPRVDPSSFPASSRQEYRARSCRAIGNSLIDNPNYKVTCYLNERCRITDLSEVRSRVPAPAFHLPTSLKLPRVDPSSFPASSRQEYRARSCRAIGNSLIDNPNYKGIWRAPLITNPNYKGKWTPRRIANPDFFRDMNPFKMTPINAVGFELWSMSPLLLFDNIIITDDPEVAEDWARQTFHLKRAKMFKDSKTIRGRMLRAMNYKPGYWALYAVYCAIPVSIYIIYLIKRVREKDSVVERAMKFAGENPWVYVVVVIVTFVIVGFFTYLCCGPKSDDSESHKKTDAVTEDDPHQSENEEEHEPEEAPKKKADLDQPEPDSTDNVETTATPVIDTEAAGDGQRKRKPRKE